MPLAAAASTDCIENRDRLLLKIIDSNLAEGARQSGQWLACRVGCTECCIGPFPITMLDARRLQRALADLESREPARAAAIRARVHPPR
jgi:hypothetical protein